MMFMTVSHFRSRRKASGGRYTYRRKKLKDRGNFPVLVNISPLKKTTLRVRAGQIKERIFASQIVNLYDPKEKRHYSSKIESVIESPSNRDYIRRNIMTKGCLIKTDKGIARITSRPGQEGTVNAVLIE
mgnify:CR=1 FL=1